MPDDEVSRLAELAKQATLGAPEVPGELGKAIRAAAAGPGDPWLVAGVLIAGLAHLIGTAIPPERRQDCAAAALATLREELWKSGLG